jgi:ornithine cyclodeaminase
MLYLNQHALKSATLAWRDWIDVIHEAIGCLHRGDYAQPLKPYLRFRRPQNRIIAMPAYVGGSFDTAGLKWIASFPGNLERGLPRAHSVLVLNDAETGEPTCIVNTGLLSAIRTAAVSGWVARQFDAARPAAEITCGITGFGIIGQTHFGLCLELFGERLRKVRIFDPRAQSSDLERLLPPDMASRIESNAVDVALASTWQEAYSDADVFITCTVTSERYVDQPPKPGSLQLNVSLRDYTERVFDYMKGGIVVDDWREVCRENTDIELFHRQCDLQERQVLTLVDLLDPSHLRCRPAQQPIMFNPMGMGIFDIAVATRFYRHAVQHGLGVQLT